MHGAIDVDAGERLCMFCCCVGSKYGDWHTAGATQAAADQRHTGKLGVLVCSHPAPPTCHTHFLCDDGTRLHTNTTLCFVWLQGYHWRTLVFVTPLFFGMCHLHHCWSVLQTYGFLPRAAAAQTVLQLLYTTVFGWYATWLFLATGSILAAVVVHSICNVMGLPPFWRMGGYSIACSILGVALFWPTALRVLHPPPDHALWWWQNCVTTHPAFATRG
jgi:hypothetical protein